MWGASTHAFRWGPLRAKPQSSGDVGNASHYLGYMENEERDYRTIGAQNCCYEHLGRARTIEKPKKRNFLKPAFLTYSFLEASVTDGGG
jgi:hypothetical protein